MPPLIVRKCQHWTTRVNVNDILLKTRPCLHRGSFGSISEHCRTKVSLQTQGHPMFNILTYRWPNNSKNLSKVALVWHSRTVLVSFQVDGRFHTKMRGKMLKNPLTHCKSNDLLNWIAKEMKKLFNTPQKVVQSTGILVHFPRFPTWLEPQRFPRLAAGLSPIPWFFLILRGKSRSLGKLSRFKAR